MGDIQKACENYKNLLNKEYFFVIGRKNKTVHIKLKFTKYEFYHLAGLHKLIDIESLNNQNSKKVFDNISNGVITQDLCQKSKHYSDIDERISFIESLEDFFDSNKIVFKYNNKINSISVIDADYLLKNENDLKNFYVFISMKGKNSDTYFCRSAFPRDKSEPDYAAGHTAYTLLYKEKIDLLANEKQILYVNPSYRER
ncbi:MAG: PBECR4 domain-containing protein [Ruminococcus sp.]|nr:PBECR4 domain-containing protein [Ruminococcus sp.]MCM1380689.1 PBECR4 domain-containing protein [Muribaculaceae bacterium]MCM1479993.1 PBECR4 domain-containing protein [Muribaculaceae bacterium]